MKKDRHTPEPRVTLQTIADRLGVSRTTISNAYGRPDQLNPALREKIFAVANEIGYSGPDPAARNLRRGRSGVFGVVFPENLTYAVTDPAALLFLRGVAEATEPTGSGLLLLPVPPDAGAGAAVVREAMVDGFLTYSLAEDDPRVRAVLDRRLPTVFVDEPTFAEAGFVGIDDRAGARAVAEHLVALGHRLFGVITFPLIEDDRNGIADLDRQEAATYTISRARLDGYAEALRSAGLLWRDVPVYECSLNGSEHGEAAAGVLLDRVSRPTALLCFSDLLALGALRAAAVRGLLVPGVLSVTGFDDIPQAASAQPPLTTVRQPLIDKGRVAARLLLEGWVDGPAPVVSLPTELVVRASSGPAMTVN